MEPEFKYRVTVPKRAPDKGMGRGGTQGPTHHYRDTLEEARNEVRKAVIQLDPEYVRSRGSRGVLITIDMRIPVLASQARNKSRYTKFEQYRVKAGNLVTLVWKSRRSPYDGF